MPCPDQNSGEASRHNAAHPDPDRLARMIANGELPFAPPVQEAERIAVEVVRLRRGRLLRHIAQAIAHDIADGAG